VPHLRTALVLFTRDLRVHDHPALAEAIRSSDLVVPLFVLDPALLGSGAAANRIAFLVEALADLRESLRSLGGDLLLRRGDPVEETLRLATAVGARTVFAASDGSAYARARESRLASACRDARIELRTFPLASAVPPGALVPAGGDHYRVFTPYLRRWSATRLRPVAPRPARLRLPAGLDPGELPAASELSRGRPSPGRPRGGETAGRQRLERWLAEGLAGYEALRDDLAADATSRLSPYLHLGCLSAVELVTRVRELQERSEFERQLAWRDFFGQLLAANPRSARESLRDRGDRWRDDAEALERWRAGLTGYPLVDAAMRQLAAEGFVHNRARLVAGSFLAKTLYLDWRDGARAFSELLVDGDVASNVGNWQWVAGTGADTRPNRILDPLAQARRFDPRGAYVRRWVPELAGLAGAAAHEPWRAPTGLVAPEYPARIIDHVAAAASFRAAREARRSPVAAEA
jgi:deoxyribodipyrimidine photo-lyase